MILLVYVDDIILVGSSDSLLSSFITSLKTAFAMKDLGPLHHFLGIEATFDTSSTKLLLTQNKYSLELLKKHDMMGCKPCRTPVSHGQKDSISDGVPLPDATVYKRLVGGLQYLTLTRPNISFALAKRILRYIKGSLEQGITRRSGDCRKLVSYCDSDWEGFPDTRKSTSRYCVFIGGNLVSWSLKKKQTISRSSTEAEYRGLANADAEILWLSYLFEELSVRLCLPCTLYCDNMGAGSLTTNPIFHARTKHIEVDYHMVRNLVNFGFLRVSYIRTLSQIVDFFTKGLSKDQFHDLRCKLMPSVKA
ncbi:uncharacterized protein LOC113331324 [Papaver somniferum]|uniref:uncharacterized protein LOC113331324 n=1 Tax=Papaver somniferum TaxID=3469 RepID=UPI000E6F8FF6|nr:uncharacterized protein LOC113331324 [Papaver somniferum]